MASPLIAARTAIPQFRVWANSQKKAKAPYDALPEEEPSSELRRNDFFSGLSEATLRALQKIMHTVSYPTGAILFMEGQAPRGVYILFQGRAKLLTTNSDGRTLILKIVQPGEELGLNSVITGRPYEMTAEVLQPTQMTFIGREDFLKFLGEHGDACLHFAQHLSRDCHSAYELIRTIGMCQSVSERVAKFLLDWSSNGVVTDGTVRAKLGLTHEEIAQLIGTTRESVTRALSEFKKQRTIELNGSTLVLRNKPALLSLAGD